MDDVQQTDTRTTKSLGNTTATVSRMELRTERVRVLARPEPARVESGTELREALREMQQARGEALLICHGRRLVGIVTERDVLDRVLGREIDDSRPVDDFMTADPHTLTADATLFEALRMMERGRYRNLPLVDDDGNVIGLLRQQDVLEYVAEAFPQEILNLPPRPHQLMEDREGA
ncbi:MAG TPA: CBS domain-containing protein [Candidatus Caenarcaniphilales bacterium]|nr:CBS domain-containing protein [Candidatus Caenarcaniphilales bacterium]